MNIENSFMANHVFTEKNNSQYGGDDNINFDKILTGAIPLSKIFSNKNILSINHLGIPCGLISHKIMKGGDNTHIPLKKNDGGATQYDNSLSNKLFSLTLYKDK
jgi:hypothetical protein